jgi:hypothetical protein
MIGFQWVMMSNSVVDENWLLNSICQIALIKQVDRLSFWKHPGDVRSSANTTADSSLVLSFPAFVVVFSRILSG